jgi:DNA-binding response OmpR family regulator
MLAGKRLLIVEDDFLIGASLSDVLTKHGCLVRGPVFTIKEAVQILESERLDGALLDLKLQDGLALDIARRLRAQGVPFVVLTGYPRETLHSDLRNAYYLGKPARPDVVVEVVAAALQSH